MLEITEDDEKRWLEAKTRVVLDDPELLRAITEGGAFGGSYTPAIATNMFNAKSDRAIAEVRERVEVIEVGERSWLIRLPLVNSAVFETDEGLVVVDTAMAPGGPALMDAIRSVSDQPIHTIVYTHAHVDHCMGTWAMLDDEPEIIAHVDAPARFDRYVRTRGKVSRYMSQSITKFPEDEDDWVPPTQTFSGTLTLTIGGERFDLIHARSETDDQLWVSVPGRKQIASADYYQGFLPNAGNGKRVQRYVEEWAGALRDMVALEPQSLLPAHGEAIVDDPARIAEELSVHAEALEFIARHTIDGLNARRRQDEIPDDLELPAHLAEHRVLAEQYVSPADISRMIIKQYCGWWDDIPSHWSPHRFDEQSAMIADLAGGRGALVDRARNIVEAQPKMACHLVDWAWFGGEPDVAIGEAVLEIWSRRITLAQCNTQEALVYLDHLADVRVAMDDLQRG